VPVTPRPGEAGEVRTHIRQEFGREGHGPDSGGGSAGTGMEEAPSPDAGP
jgi:hypothetical protein